MAIGASRRRVIRQLAIEALALTVLAGAIGAGVSALATSSTPAWAPSAIRGSAKCDSTAGRLASRRC